MNQKKATIHDIASELGVTASTVSRALSGNPRISQNTRRAVLKTAKALNYEPNQIASALRSGKTQLIGMLVPIINRSFFSSIIRGVEDVANKLDYRVIVSQSDEKQENEAATLKAFLNARVDGVIASIGKQTRDFDHYQEILDSGLPLVLFDRTTSDLQTGQVVIDDYEGAYKATVHLIEQGCRRIAHFTARRKIDIYKKRCLGYLDALRDHNIPIDKKLIFAGDLQLSDGRRHTAELINKQLPFDAVFAASDYAVMGAMQVLKEKKISIPDQVALVGFLNEPFTSFTDPPLSTINQFPMEMGKAAARIFFDSLESERGISEQKIVIEPELIVRASSEKRKTNS
ncbi:LacI family DNA-binding transcriptional regulator [Poritiphilus flavus]|uniref:Substrate-binding domain-containing protein n=1 Tax=Poritiphilus flavus TaxID=2697053 RepID=A0A6L9EGL8_9FLAO|nr:LacI family DNA-binding transcriptional regulator [Poritiphilus flavus]NAS13823.1 substrate-binding domain-containing protein [Poritiphilus flavus]